MPTWHCETCVRRPLLARLSLVLGFFLCSWLGAALAAPSGGPWSDDSLDPADRMIDRLGRAHGGDLLYGARSPGALGMAYRWQRLNAAADPGQVSLLDQMLGPEMQAAAYPGFTRPWSSPPWAVRPSGRLAVGDAIPALQSGDWEPGLLAVRGSFAGAGYVGPLELAMAPEFRVNAISVASDGGAPLGAEGALRNLWAGLHTDLLRVGIGTYDRWFGPGRYGGLMLTDNGRPAPLGSAAIEGRVFERYGRARAEIGAGWLDGFRGDVHAPGWLLMDFRWAPVPALELGATRMGLFGGSGRPAPQVGQLILPTQPHIEGDQDQDLPDQDEIAALDARVTLPLGKWVGRSGTPGTGFGIDYLELYTQYGGEDVIARKIASIPVPALAGIANLFGGEVGVGDLVLTIEHSRVLDDRFRWYRGHRVYHEGFTREGQVMGHPEGGDSRSTWLSARWFSGEWGVEATHAHALRVGVVDIEGDNLRALIADERIQRYGLRGWWLTDKRGWLHGGLVLVRTVNPDFVVGDPNWSWRVSIGR